MTNQVPLIVDWLQTIAASYAPVDWLLNSNRISFSEDSRLHEEERLTFALAMLLGERNLVIELPTPSARLAAGVVAGLLVSDLVAYKADQRRVLKGDVLFITRHIGIGRSTLADVSLERVALAEIWSVQSANQAEKVEGRGRPRLFVSPPSKGRLLPDGIHLAATVVDASHPLTLERLDILLNSAPVVDADTIVLIVPLGYDYSPFVDDSWLRWTWDWDSINQLSHPQREVDERTVKTSWSRTLLVCEDPKLDETLGKVRTKLSLLSKYVSYPPGELLRAWGIYHRLANLAVPLGEYEDAAYHNHYARPLRHVIKSLQESRPSVQAATAGQALWASEWSSLVDLLAEAYELLKGDASTKFWALVYLLEEHVQAGFKSPLLVVTPTDMEASILLRNLRHFQEDLPRYLHPDGLSFIKPKSLAEAPYPTCSASSIPLLLGPLTSRWRYLNATLLNTTLLVYPHQVGLAQREIEAIVSSILSKASHESQLETLMRIRPAAQISREVHRAEVIGEETVTLPVLVDIREVEDVPERKHRELNTSVELSPNWAWDEEDITFIPPVQIRHKEDDATLETQEGLITLFLSDNTLVVTPPEQTFDVFRFVTEELVEVNAAHIEEGDLLIIVDDGNYANLFERSVEALEAATPRYARLSTWLSIWELVKEDALQACDGDYSKLHQELIRRGISISEQAVRSWYADIMAPRETEAVFAMIELSGIKAAKSHERQIRNAIGHIRGMRRAIGRRIQRLIKQSAVEPTIAGRFANAIDLAVEDVLAAAKYVRVAHVQYQTVSQATDLLQEE